jgi:aryl-alcohol dehydrogenase-like predicted oxidoreductase
MTEKTHGFTRREFVRQVGLGAAALTAISPTPLALSMVSTTKSGMGYRTLGRTGLKISEVGLGAGSISPSGSNLIRAALSQGINFIETSSNYRNSQVETAIGQVVKSMGNRDKVVILTKTGNTEMGRLLDSPSSEVGKAVREELEGSLKRLQTDYIDVYMCPYQANSPQEATYPVLQEILEKFKKEGKIRFTGLSTHNDYANICMAAIEGGYYDAIMFPVNFSTLLPHIGKAVLDSKKAEKDARGEGGKKRGGEERPIIDVREVLKAAQRKNVGVVAMKGAQEGFLPPIIHDRLKGEFAKDTKLSFHQFAYRYVLDQPQVSTVSIRMANMLHLNEALVLPQKTLKG